MNFKPYDINYEIRSNANPAIWLKGYVHIPKYECENEELEWYGWDGTQYQYEGGKIFHDGINITGATPEQIDEVEEFRQLLHRNVDWIDDCIVLHDEGETKTYDRGDYLLIINEGKNE